MKKHFYSHLVNFDALVITLANLALTKDERDHLLHIAHDSVHHAVLDEVLSALSQQYKRHFLKLLLHDEHDRIWEHLNERIDNIEDKIKETALKLQEELHEDVKKLEK
jgi:hypothetical protein